jgi:excisionase family DNA binding protein
MGKTKKTGALAAATPPPANGLLTREDLIARWAGHGSESTFRRAERAGLLRPRTDGTRVAYSWPDVWDYEGGLPPIGHESEYQQSLVTPDRVAMLCTLGRGGVLRAARSGELPCRRVGRHRLFVPAEVERWLYRRRRYA